MPELSILDPSGDTKLSWDPQVQTQVEVAKEKFNQLVVHQGYTAYALKEKDDEPGEMIREFNPQATRILLTPRSVGG